MNLVILSSYAICIYLIHVVFLYSSSMQYPAKWQPSMIIKYDRLWLCEFSLSDLTKSSLFDLIPPVLQPAESAAKSGKSTVLK